jgi:hypothetical protein
VGSKIMDVGQKYDVLRGFILNRGENDLSQHPTKELRL